MMSSLAEKMRPKRLEDIVGQEGLFGKNGTINILLKNKKLFNMIFFGPPGTGKTSASRILAEKSGLNFKFLNGSLISTEDIKEALLGNSGFFKSTKIVLYIDEIQYLNKKQQQTLLESSENGELVLIASTIENPNFCVYEALRSRCSVFEFEPITSKEIYVLLKKALIFLEKDMDIKIKCEDSELIEISDFAGGDARKALNTLEICVLSAKTTKKIKVLTKEKVRHLTKTKNFNYDKGGGEHYELLSALQKSLRGSDADAAIYYLAKLLIRGEIESSCRRILICACEDVGLANPQIIPIVKSCVDVSLYVGMPEARIALGVAVILISKSPKSNSGYLAVNKAFEDLNSGKDFPVPINLTNSKNSNYIYPHNFQGNFVLQDYLPSELKNFKYYEYGRNKFEQAYKEYWDKIINISKKNFEN